MLYVIVVDTCFQHSKYVGYLSSLISELNYNNNRITCQEPEKNLQSSPTGPAEHCAGGSLPKSCNSYKQTVIRFVQAVHSHALLTFY